MGCGDEKLSKYLTQTFIAHCNAMICQQVTLSGDAEWPKVADAVIEAAFPCLCVIATVRNTNMLLTKASAGDTASRLSVLMDSVHHLSDALALGYWCVASPLPLQFPALCSGPAPCSTRGRIALRSTR